MMGRSRSQGGGQSVDGERGQRHGTNPEDTHNVESRCEPKTKRWPSTKQSTREVLLTLIKNASARQTTSACAKFDAIASIGQGTSGGGVCAPASRVVGIDIFRGNVVLRVPRLSFAPLLLVRAIKTELQPPSQIRPTVHTCCSGFRPRAPRCTHIYMNQRTFVV